MTRPARRLRPALDQLEGKALLSAGMIGHEIGAHPAVLRTEQNSYYNYLYVQTSGFTATNVSWTLYVQGKPIQSQRMGNVGPNPVLVESSVATSSSFPGQFVFTYNVGTARKQTSGYGTSWNGQGPQPSIPTLTLSAQTTGLGGHHRHRR